MTEQVPDDTDAQDIDDKLHAAFEKRRLKESEQYMPKSKIIGTCLYCGGNITYSTSWKYICESPHCVPYPRIHGECFCSGCGLIVL